MHNKKIAERLNRELDEIGVPCLMTERVQACAKLFNIPRFTVEAILKGNYSDFSHMEKIARELEIDVNELLNEKVAGTRH
ncbi:Uncharacterised protein [Legionella adelaidensis]|uniref:XRE family transcriptional regulator n=1 Tax=Legionella adelaidensis TaxID=45056 RepID=A0A0W0R6I7_9GAMM|nr:hypothetical protein [Legionella adelaidensis]KTC66635.1 hypothetical protein Lade_1293 [Legionella adelaidensis]VEH81021.1 Uncharacterised protein [Legionella adelaidensis]